MNQSIFNQMDLYILVMNNLNEEEERMITENNLEGLPDLEIKQAEVYELYHKLVYENFELKLIDQANESIGHDFVSYSFSKKLKEIVDETFFPIDRSNEYSLNRKGCIESTSSFYFINKDNETRFGRFTASNDLEAMFWFRSAIEKGLIEVQLVFEK